MGKMNRNIFSQKLQTLLSINCTLMIFGKRLTKLAFLVSIGNPNRIGGVMVTVLASSAVDLGFD
jgi:hypothetical protein